MAKLFNIYNDQICSTMGGSSDGENKQTQNGVKIQVACTMTWQILATYTQQPTCEPQVSKIRQTDALITRNRNKFNQKARWRSKTRGFSLHIVIALRWDVSTTTASRQVWLARLTSSPRMMRTRPCANNGTRDLVGCHGNRWADSNVPRADGPQTTASWKILAD